MRQTLFGYLVYSLLQTVSACLNGFIGRGCEPCPASLYCDGTAHACPGAAEGSRACNYPVPMLQPLNTHRMRARSWSTTAKVRVNPSSSPCGCYVMNSNLWVVLDAGEAVVVGGIASQGRDGAWVSSFLVDTSMDNLTWTPLGGVYAGNSDDVGVVETRAPFVVVARYVRLHVVNFFLWPSFRAALLVADRTSCPDGSLCVNGSVVACPANQRCVNGTALECSSNSLCVNGMARTCPTNYSCKDGSVACHALVGATVRWNGTACESRCRKANKWMTGGCQPVASQAKQQTSQASPVFNWVIRSRVFPAVACTLVDATHLNVPIHVPIHYTAAVQIDGRPWMAWSWGQLEQTIIPLPSPVHISVRLRVYTATRVVEFVGRIRPRAMALSVPAIPIVIRWGIGSGTVGDTEAVCSVSAPPGMALELQSAAFPSYSLARQTLFEWNGMGGGGATRWDLDCTNVSDGVQWLAYNTEVQGMEQSLTGFAHEECSRGASAWLVPQTDRPHVHFVAVKAVASEIL